MKRIIRTVAREGDGIDSRSEFDREILRITGITIDGFIRNGEALHDLKSLVFCYRIGEWQLTLFKSDPYYRLEQIISESLPKK